MASWLLGGEMTVDLSKWWVKYTNGMNRGRSRPSDKGRGVRSSRPWDRGAAVSKKFFSILRASVWSKNKGPRSPSPGSATDQYRWIRNDLGLHTFLFLFHSISVPQWSPFNVKKPWSFLTVISQYTCWLGSHGKATGVKIACEQALQVWRAKRAARERALGELSLTSRDSPNWRACSQATVKICWHSFS